MAIERIHATAYLSQSLGLFASEVGISGPGQTTIWNTATDDALLSLSVLYGDLAAGSVADTGAIAYRALLTYHAYVRLLEGVMASVDTSLDGPNMSKKDSQYVAALERRIDAARKQAAPYATAGPLADADGYGDYGSFNVGHMTLTGSEFS